MKNYSELKAAGKLSSFLNKERDLYYEQTEYDPETGEEIAEKKRVNRRFAQIKQEISRKKEKREELLIEIDSLKEEKSDYKAKKLTLPPLEEDEEDIEMDQIAANGDE